MEERIMNGISARMLQEAVNRITWEQANNPTFREEEPSNETEPSTAQISRSLPGQSIFELMGKTVSDR